MNWKTVLSVALVWSLAVGLGQAQQAVSVEGMVTDTLGGVLPGARVEAISDGRIIATEFVGSNGRYSIGVPAGESIELTVHMEGFSSRTVRVTPTAGTTQDFELGIASLTDTVVVTASGTERSLASTTESLTVFTSDDIAELGSHSIADVVAQIPGLDIGATGREGAQTSLFSRGGESDYNHVLIDGVRVNINGGQFDFSRVSAAEIDRVEVVRGAQSALYGSDAIGSVVQIFTKRGSASGSPRLTGSVEGGSFNTFRGNVRVLGGAPDKIDYQLGISQRSTEGAFADILPQNDEFDQTSFDGNFGARLSQYASLRAGFRYSDAKGYGVGPIDYAPGDTGQIADSEDLSWYVNFDGMLTSSISHRANVNIFRYDSLEEDTILDDFGILYTILEGTPGALFPDSPRLARKITEEEFNDLLANSGGLGPDQFLAYTPFGVGFGDFLSEFPQNFRRNNVDYQVDALWLDNQVFSAGYEYVEEKDPTVALFSIDNHSFFAQQQFALDQWFVTVGARVDSNSRFGTEVSPKLSAGGFPVPYRPGGVSSVKVFVNVGRGIKNPTFGELFGGSFADGNPDLKPERALTVDAGAELTFDDQRWMGRFAFFNNNYKDQVAFLSTGFGLDDEPDFLNIAGADANGVELDFGLQRPVGGFTARASYALVDTEVVATTSTSEQFQPGQPLLRRPKHAGTFHVNYTRGPVSVHFNLRAVGERHDAAFAGLFTPPAPGFPFGRAVDITVDRAYTLINLGGQLRLHDAATAFLHFVNLGNERYSTALGYPGMPRAVVVGARFNIGG